MPYKITNVSLEHQHSLKRRTATRLQMEPIIAGKRLLLRKSVVLTNEQYEINKEIIAQCIQDGVVSIEATESTPLPESKFKGIPADVVWVDESKEVKSEVIEPVVVTEPVQNVAPTPLPPIPSDTQYTQKPAQSYSQPMSNNTQRRNDPRRGGR